MDQIKWFRIIGDTVFAVGLGTFAWFVFTVGFKKPNTNSENKDI
jgi:nitric oxide reductase subunit B